MIHFYVTCRANKNRIHHILEIKYKLQLKKAISIIPRKAFLLKLCIEFNVM